MNKSGRQDLPFCPECGKETLSFFDGKCWKCSACGFTLYHNVAAAVALILEYAGKILLVKRGKEPQKGFFDLPGGFVDPQERAEDAVKRECFEETGFTPENPEFFCSFPNIYCYKDILYNTCDLVFTAKIPAGLFKNEDELLQSLKRQESEIEGLVLAEKTSLPLEQVAFPSLKKALELYLDSNPVNSSCGIGREK